MKEITDANFRYEILNSTKPIMLMFTAEFCAPCKTLTPILKTIGERRRDIMIASCDAEANPVCVRHFEIGGLPTILTFAQGENIDYINQVPDRRKLEDMAKML